MTAVTGLWRLVKAIPPVRWGVRWLRGGALSLRRAWMERNAAFRAIGPAWPVALSVSVFALTMVLTDQGREVLLVTAEEPQLLRLFVLVLTFVSIALMLTSLFVMSAKTQALDTRVREETLRGQPRFAEDPVHSSASLRTRAAFVLGITLPLSVFWVLTRDPSPHPAGSELGRALEAAAVGALFYGAALVMEHVLHLALESIRDWRQAAQKDYAIAHTERRRHDFNAGVGATQRADDPRTETKTPAEAVQKENKAEGARSAAWLAYCTAALFHWFVAPPMRWVLPVGAAMMAFAQSAERQSVMPAAILVTLGAMTAAYVFLYVRHTAMREVDTERGRQLVVDRRLQATHRGVSFFVVFTSFVLLWAGFFFPEIHRSLGPATVVVLGLFLVVNVLTWFVRSALGPPPLDRPPPRARGTNDAPAHLESNAEKLARPLRHSISWIVRQVADLMFWLGRGIETLQGFVQPQRVLAAGAGFVAVDWFVLPALESMDPAPGLLGASIMVLTGFSVAFLMTLGLVHFLRTPDDRSETAQGKPRQFTLLRRLFFPPREGAVRFPSWILLAPFLLAALGENHDVTRMPATSSYPLSADYARADAWLEEGQRRGYGSAEAPIPAVVVLAEGGGIRAASHTGQLLAALDRQQAIDGFTFFDNVYVISGVSGGAIGASAFLAERADRAGQPADAASPSTVQSFLGEDLLTPLLAGLFASDFVSIFVPFNGLDRLRRAANPDSRLVHEDGAALPVQIPSRGDFFEHAMSQAWREHTSADNNRFEQPLEQVAAIGASPEAPAPIVMFSTFSADDGMLAAASNTRFGDCPAPAAPTFDVRLVTLQDCLAAREDNVWTLPLAAAAHVSARFPASNPPGLIDSPSQQGGDGAWDGWRQRRFVDGGYVDNSGAAAAAEAVQVLRARARARGLQVRVIVLHIFARAADGGARAALGRSAAFNELSAPVSGFFQSRERSGRLPTVALCQLIATTDMDSEKCSELNEARFFDTRTSASSSCREDMSVINTAGADWVSAPLCVSGREGAPDNYLLGWLMKSDSHRQIGDDMAAIADDVLRAMARAARGTSQNPAPAP